tara:strand:+ start:457 stop:768 length:312 start_codon:yes stop_codon:yes gene_type:complete
MSINLRIDNPYSRGTIFSFSGGDKFFRRTPIDYIQGPTDMIHLVQTQDTLSNLSYRYYNNSKYWWVLADVNKIHDVFDIATDWAGKNIIIPDMDRVQAFYITR